MDQRNVPSYAWLYGVAFVVSAGAAAVGASLLARGSATPTHLMIVGGALLAAGAMGLFGIAGTLPIALSIGSSQRRTLLHQQELLEALTDRLQQVSVMMNLLSEQQLLSDKAKSVAFREKDREALRRAIREEILRQDYEAATALANDMEATFGYRGEAEQFRQEINARRQDALRKRIGEQLVVLDQHIRAEAWGAAVQEAYRVMQMFPADEAVQRLPQEIENRRQARKTQLLDSWHEALARHDVDGSIEILKKLDQYLTPAEAQAMEETARNIFKEKREALRVTFTQAVQDENWRDAVRLGDEIMRDFPNTRIAQEVRERMDVLRQRADEAQPAMVKA